MKISLRKGFSFGLTSGIITTLGVIVGLDASTSSQIVVLGGIFAIAVADAFSDALGMHISEESEMKHSAKEVWESTIATFLSKFFFALTFAVPVTLLALQDAVIVSIVWGLLLISLFSLYMSRKEGTKPYKVIAEHLVIAVLVVVVTYLVGHWVATLG